MTNEDEEAVLVPATADEESITAIAAAESTKSNAEDVPICSSNNGIVVEVSERESKNEDAEDEGDNRSEEEEEAIVLEPSSFHVDLPAPSVDTVVAEEEKIVVEEVVAEEEVEEEEIIFEEKEEEEANDTIRVEEEETVSVALQEDDIPEEDPNDDPLPPPPPPRSHTNSSSSVPPPPPPPVGINSARRTAWHNQLRAYEANRRSSHATKIASSSLYWRSFRALIHSSVEETKCAERMIRANIIADATYAQSMKAASFNWLNDDGTPILDEKKKQRVWNEREKESNGGASISPSNKTAPSPKSFGSSTTTSDPRSSLLKSLLESHSIMADRFEESASVIEKELLPQLVTLREKLEDEVKVHETLGNAFLECLEGADTAVLETWDLYYTIAVKALSGNSSNSSRRKGATLCSNSSSSVGEDITTTVTTTIHDVWLAEMRYRVAVAYVSALWDKAHSELSRLFTRLKETECQRRLRLADVLRRFVQKKERLFLGLTSILTPAIQDLANKHIDNAAIEEDVQTAIRIRAQNMKKAEIEAKKAGTTKSRDHPGLVGVDIVSGKFELTSPLTSELLCKAKVVERKVGGVMGGGWKPSLAVVTMDDFLHLFDIASSTSHHKIGCGSAPEVAFHTLMPPITIPTQDTISKLSALGEKSFSQKGWSEISPSMSIILPNSTISFIDSGNSSKPNNCLLEITETYINHGASLVFGKTSTRKVQIRSSTRDEILDWISFIKAEK